MWLIDNNHLLLRMATLQFEPQNTFSMDPIELEKMINVIGLRHEHGYNQFELSFLLGFRDLREGCVSVFEVTNCDLKRRARWYTLCTNGLYRAGCCYAVKHIK